MKTKIINSYEDWILQHGTAPESVFLFCKKLKISERDFFQLFSDFKKVEAATVVSWFEKVVEDLQSQELYQSYSAREKILAIYFAFFESLLDHRSFVLSVFNEITNIKGNWARMELLRKRYVLEMDGILKSAMLSGEFEDRKFVSSRYADMLWLNFVFVFNFWVKDSSPGFERTDACIEKSLNLTFDLLARNTIDQLFDFGKFMMAGAGGNK
jgi:hypothetical protein